MNRIDRISAILIQLQSRRTVKACDIAKRFNISLRTVYRDIRTLEEAGIPLIGEAGIGYSLASGYRLPPVMFTRDEAAAFLTAEKMVEKLTDDANSASYRSAMYKIKAVLRSSDKDYLETIDNQIEVLKARKTLQHQLKVNPLQDILQAVADKRVLYVVYKGAYKTEETNRFIEPVGIFYLDGFWHLIAWCRLRQDYRDFRFDRLLDLRVSEQRFDTNHPPVKEHLNKLYTEHPLQSIIIRVRKDTVVYLGEQKYYHGLIAEKELPENIEMSFMTWSIEGFSRWFLTFADYATIVEPVALKEKVRQQIQKILENL